MLLRLLDDDDVGHHKVKGGRQIIALSSGSCTVT